MHVLSDGSRDTVYLHGDEYHHFYTDLKGRVIPGSEYTDEALAGQTMQQAGRSALRAPQQKMLYSSVPARGKVRVPVILVNFSDLAFTLQNPKEQFDDLFNGAGGSNPNATGSVHDYYIASSDSALSLEYEVFGPYTLTRTMEYYGQNKKSGSYTDHNVHVRELVIDAVNAADQAGVDFSRFDNDNDGVVDNVSIVVAGYNEAEGGAANTIWPHYSAINSTTQYSGKEVSGYLVISEYRGSSGKVQAGIGTYCHEFGHALGLPDLYDTQNQNNYTVGEWDIMCSGCYNNNSSTPPTFTAFERFMMGWLVPEQITTAGMRVLEPIETSNRALMIAAKTHNMNPMEPSPSEYFLLENRQRIGWDGGASDALVATGLLVSHVTFSQTGWVYNTFNNQHPLGFDIVSAGSYKPTYSSGADVFPGVTMRTSWTPVLNNGSELKDYTLTQIKISQFEDMCISMQVGGNPDEMMRFSQDVLPLETPFLNGSLDYDTAEVNLIIPPATDGTNVRNIVFYLSAEHFRFSFNEGLSWYGSGEKAVIGVHTPTTVSLPVKVVYLPTRKSCNYETAYLTAETYDGQLGTQIALAGRAPRPIYISTPEIEKVTDLTPTSFNISWEPQDDAQGYYYTLYTVGEGTSEEVERFEQFDVLDNIRACGWDANFVNPMTVISDSGKAVLFENTGNYIQSPLYIYPPTAVTFWLSNNFTPTSSDGETGGDLRLSGTTDGEHWETVATLFIQRTTRNVFRTLEIDTTHQWRQFRLSYTHIGGKGGVVVDSWTAHLSKNVQYVYRLKEHEIGRGEADIVFRQLNPSTTYYYSMQAYEEKGCEPHYTPLSAPLAIRTLDKDTNPRIKAIRTGKGQYTISLPEASDGKHYLNVYSYTGELIIQLQPAYGAMSADLPLLEPGKLYLVKYYSGSMSRKDMNTKILSY